MTMEKCEHFNEEPGQTGEMTSNFDIATGEVSTRATGFWSIRQATAFFEDWVRIVRRIHAADRPVSALVDMSEGGVQSAEVATLIANATTGLYRDGDAIAMLVPTSLAKMQMRRVLDARFHEFFTSRTAAEAWLKGRSLGRQPLRRVS